MIVVETYRKLVEVDSAERAAIPQQRFPSNILISNKCVK